MHYILVISKPEQHSPLQSTQSASRGHCIDKAQPLLHLETKSFSQFSCQIPSVSSKELALSCLARCDFPDFAATV